MTPQSSAGWQSSAGNSQRQRQPGWGDEVQDSPVAAEQNEEWLRVNFEDLPGSGRSEGSTAVVGDIDLTYVMLQPRIEETVLAYLDLHEEALILTIDQAMMRSSSCLIISLWTERAIRQAWPSSEHTTTSSTWTSAAFLQLRHEQLKSGQASEDRKYRWAQFRSITDGRDGPQADRLGEHQEPDGGRGFWWLTDVREHCQPDRASSSADALVRSSFAQRSQQITRFCACPRGCTTLVHGAIRYCDYCFVEAGEPQPIP